MTDNDYIAEYIKEKHPQLIQGLDFAMWKGAKMIAEGVRAMMEKLTDAANTLNACGYTAEEIQAALAAEQEQQADRYEGETEDILKKIQESGEENDNV